MSMPEPTEIELERSRRVLRVIFDNGERFELPCAYLRTHSPSAEVRGHGLSEPKLLTGKDEVNISAIAPVGRYAIQLIFDDGHDSGIYSWSFLYDLGENMAANVDRYRQRLSEAGLD